MATSTQTEQKWSYPLVELALDKHGQRTATRDGAASELVGFDGQFSGGLEPCPGFVKIDSLFGVARPGTSQIVTGMTVPGGGWVDDSSNPLRILPGDFWAANLRSGVSSGVYGYVYRVSITGPNRSAFYFCVAGEAFTTGVHELVTWSEDEYGIEADVVVKGRYCWLFRRGREPILFFYDESGTFTVQTDTGPGAQPTLRAPDQQVGWPIGIDAEGAQVVLTGQLPEADFSMTSQEDGNVRSLDPGDYAFAYQLFDKKSGRRSPISVIAPCQEGVFTQELVGGSGVGTGDADDARYACIELVYNPAKWTHAYIYRSVRVQSVGTVFAAGILCQDNFIELSTFEAPDQTNVANITHKRILYWYEKQDKQLVSEPKYNDYYSFDADMPFGSAAEFLDDTLFVAGIQTQAVDPANQRNIKDVSEIRWSSPVEANPELFSTLYSRYTPNNERDDVVRFVSLSGNLVGFSRNRVYFVRKEAEKVRVLPIHAGFGIVGKRAAAEVGSSIYFVNDKGLKALNADGELQDIQTINRVISDEWRDNTINVSVAFDPTLSCVFVHNPDVGECGKTVCLWLSTGFVSELWDMEFGTVVRGWSTYPTPEVWSTIGTVKPRALFADYVGQVYVYDAGRSKTVGTALVGAGETRHSMLPFTGDGQMVVTSTLKGLTANPAPWKGGGASSQYARLYINEWVLSDTMIGKQLYIMDGSGVGNQFYIYDVDIGNDYLYVIANDAGTSMDVISVGSEEPRVCVSPVYCRWVGHQLGVQNDMDMTYKASDFFEVRQVSSLGVSFVDVSGPYSGSVWSRFKGLVFKANDTESLVGAYPTDLDGNQVESIKSNKATYYAAMRNTDAGSSGAHGPSGNSLFPGFEVVCTDLYFSAVEARVRGNKLGTDRVERAQ